MPRLSSGFLGFFLLGICAYFISDLLLSLYTGGDQRHYRALYEALSLAPFSQIGRLQSQYTGSAEPLFGLLMWLGAKVMGHDAWISVFNAGLVIAVVVLLRRWRVPVWVIGLVLTNRYLLVLLTSAERLKFAYLLVILVPLASGYWRVLLGGAAPLAHFQTLILFGTLAFGQVRRLAPILRRGRLIAGLIVAGSMVYVFARYGQQIDAKFRLYAASNRSLVELTNILILIPIGLIAARDKKQWLILSVPIIAGVYFLGAERVNMIGFTVLVWLLVTERRATHPAFVVLLLYFSFRSIDFLQRVAAYGDGFARF